MAELQQLFDSVEAKQYKRPDMNGDLRLGFASNDFSGAKWKNLTGAAQWSDGAEMITLDLWGVCKGFQARLDALEAWQAAGAPAARAGQVGRRGAERPAAGRPHRLQPEHAGEDEVRPGGDGRLHPGGRRGTFAEQERRDGGPRHQARRAGADGGRRELRGHDGPGQRVRHAGPGAACGSRAPHEAARGPQRHRRGGPGHPDAEEGPGHEGGTTFSRPLRPTTRGPTRRCTARPRTWRSSRPRSSGSSKTTPTSSSTTRTSPSGA